MLSQLYPIANPQYILHQTKVQIKVTKESNIDVLVIYVVTLLRI